MSGAIEQVSLAHSLLCACAVKFCQYGACAVDISRSKSSPVQSSPESVITTSFQSGPICRPCFLHVHIYMSAPNRGEQDSNVDNPYIICSPPSGIGNLFLLLGVYSFHVIVSAPDPFHACNNHGQERGGERGKKGSAKWRMPSSRGGWNPSCERLRVPRFSMGVLYRNCFSVYKAYTLSVPFRFGFY